MEKSEKNFTSTVNVEETDPVNQANQTSFEPSERMTGAFLSIICSAAIPCGLIFIIAGALIGVILGFKINRDEGHPELQLAATSVVSNVTFGTKLSSFKKNGGNAAFFIDFNPSSLTAIATLTGKIIPYLSSSIMALIAFFAARRIVINSKDTSNDRLLSPHQLSILIELLGGSTYTPLKNCVQHHIKNKQKWINPLPLAFGALAAVTSLGIIIPLMDTWFSTTVTPTTVATVTKSNHTSTFGRALDLSLCSGFLNTGLGSCTTSKVPCNLECLPSADSRPAAYFLDGAPVATEVLDLTSATDYVFYHYDANTEEYYYFMNDFAVFNDRYTRDFRTTTLAVSTQCKPITSSCGLETDPINYPNYIGSQYDFHCRGGFNGSLLANGATSAANYNQTTNVGGVMAGIAFSPEAKLSTRINDSEFASFQNPLHFGTWSVGWQTSPDSDAGFDLPWDNDPEIFYDYAWNYVWMLQCSSALYDVAYSFVNGSITDWNVSLSAPESGGMLSLPFASALPLGTLSLSLASTYISTAANSSQLARWWGNEFSRYGITLLAGSMESRNNSLEQIRNNSHGATRVPMIPLFLLLGFKIMYCLAVLLLAIAAWYYTDPLETQSVKERLTVKGLAAAYFAEGATHQQVAVKNVEELFQSPTVGGVRGDAEAAPANAAQDKVAMKPTELGGWQFVKVAAGTVWTHVEPIIAGEILADANTGGMGTTGKDAAQWVGLVRK